MPEPKKWMRLDNAAKIFPAVKRRDWSNVFRLSATLTQPIDPLLLQEAVLIGSESMVGCPLFTTEPDASEK